VKTAAELREAALAKLLEAKALVGADGNVPEEDNPQFTSLMGEFRDLDREASQASTTDDNIGTIRERFEWYTGKATGTPLRFQSTELDPNSHLSAGEQFIQSDAYKGLVQSGVIASPQGRFRTDPVIVGRPIPGRMLGAATDIIQTESGGPGNALVTPYRLPGILAAQQRPLTVRELFVQETMDSGDTIEYAQQTGFDNAANAVAQAVAVDGSGVTGGVKPQSSIAWEEATAPARWIATYMVATRQALADASQVRSLIDNQGRLMLALEEEDQLLNGNGTAPNISGILDQAALQLLDVSAYFDNKNLDAIRTARRLVRTGTSRLRPTFVAMHPEDSEEFDLMQDNEGRYRAGDPFGPIGNIDDAAPIWKLRRVETEALTPGTVLVGAREGATVWERQPLTVLTADQHADFFVRNLVVILFEERLAFPVYFPTAFVKITLDEWTVGS
jgi:Phage capsid family